MRYRICAALLCHDVRLNTSVKITVDLDHAPTEQEALQLLEPAADETVTRAWCEGCPYELTVTEIQLVE